MNPQKRDSAESSYNSYSESSSSSSDSSSSEEVKSEELKLDYTTSNLIVDANINVSLVTLEDISLHDIHVLEQELLSQYKAGLDVWLLVDPRAVVKDATKEGTQSTLVDYDEILRLSQDCVDMHLRHLRSGNHQQPQEDPVESQRRAALAQRVVHDHLRNQGELLSADMEEESYQYLAKVKKVSAAHKRATLKNEQLFRNIKHLVEDCKLPLTKVAKRLKISYSRLLRIQRSQLADPQLALQRYKPRSKFVKLHERARTRIKELIVKATSPLQLADILQTIRKEMKLRLSRSMLHRYLSQELNVSYRKLRPVAYQYNNLQSKLQRQYAASIFIRYLKEQRRVINVDESIITLTEHRKRGWLARGVKNKATLPQRPGQLNIIAGISNFGELFFTVNRGKNNADTFMYFVMKLCKHLDSRNRAWRGNTVIMLDNAPYHRSTHVTSKLEQLKVPIMFLGPYHFKLAPIEVFFSYVKSHDLNPLHSSLTTKLQVQQYMKELGMHISRMSRDWIPGAFIHALNAALEDLSLVNL